MIKKQQSEPKQKRGVVTFSVVIAIAREARVQIIFTSAANLALSISGDADAQCRCCVCVCAAWKAKITTAGRFPHTGMKNTFSPGAD